MVFRVAAIPLNVFDNCTWDQIGPRHNCRHPGPDSEILMMLLRYLGISYEFVHFRTLEWGTELNGTYDGLFGALQNGSIDMIGYSLSITDFRTKFFDFTHSVIDSHISFLTKGSKPNWSSSVWLFLRVFDWPTWVCLALLMLFVLATDRMQPGKHKLLSPSYSSEKYVLIIIGLATAVMLSLYDNGLLSVLLFPPRQPYIDDVDQLLKMIENDQIKIILPFRKGFTEQALMSGSEPFYKKLQKVLNPTKIVYEHDLDKIGKMIDSGKYVYSAVMDFVYENANLFKCMKYGKVSGPETPVFRTGYMFRKGSPWVQIFNPAIVTLFEKIQGIHGKYARFVHRTSVGCKAAQTVQPLSLYSYSGILVALLICFIVSVCVLVIEIACSHRITNSRIDPTRNTKVGTLLIVDEKTVLISRNVCVCTKCIEMFDSTVCMWNNPALHNVRT